MDKLSLSDMIEQWLEEHRHDITPDAMTIIGSAAEIIEVIDSMEKK